MIHSNYTPAKIPSLGRRLERWWIWLTEPSASIREPYHRRQARFLASLLLVFILLTISLTPLASTLIDPAHPFWQEIGFQIAASTAIPLVAVYILSRTRYYKVAVLLTLGITATAIFIAAVPNRSWTEVLMFDYLLIAVLISSVFFSVTITLGVMLICIIGMLLFPILVPAAPLDEIVIGPVNFILMNSILILVVTHHRNLLERDRQAALTESESKYRLLLEQAADGICIADAQGNYELVNPKACQMLGYSEAEFLQLNIRDLVPAEELAKESLHLDELQAAKVITSERRLRCKDGSLLPVEISAGIVEGGRLQAIIRDITERKLAEEALRLSEERYRAVVENQTELVIRALPDTTVTFVNEAYYQYFGLTPNQIIGRKYLDLIPQPAREATHCHIADLVANPRIATDEHETLLPNGQIVWQQWIDRPILDAQGRVIEFLSVGRDITERKQAEAEIRRLNEELEQRVVERTAQLEAVNKELEAFSYSVSHDLRTPLRAIDGFSQALLEDYAANLDEDGQDYLRRIRQATQRMGRLIDDMLGLSRITRSEMRRESVNLSALVEAIAAELHQAEPHRAAEFVITPGVSVEGDPHLLRVALENLINNAWKFTRKQPQTLIEFGLIQQQGKPVYFIRDNGAGFDMTYADKLFGPFQRLHTRHEFEGTGIGLATVQRVILRHNGYIWAESVVGQGAIFYFSL